MGGAFEGGNFWDDYAGDDADADGLGDTPYIIAPTADPVKQDNLPLVDANAGALVSVNAEALDLGALFLHEHSEARCITLTNVSGPDPLTGVFYITGDDADAFYIVEDACSSTGLPLNGSCSVCVVFSPASEGDKSAVLKFSGDANLAVPLAGKGGEELAGDFDMDFAVTLHDLVLVLKHLAGMPAGFVQIKADTNGDGKIGFEDAFYIIRDIAGIEGG